MDVTETTFTPTEDLILDVLVARYRLGESQWPLEKRLRKPIESLSQKGYVHYRSGNVGGTLNVRLTDLAVKEFIQDSTFIPEGFRLYAEKIATGMDELGFDANVGKVIRKKFGRKSL